MRLSRLKNVLKPNLIIILSVAILLSGFLLNVTAAENDLEDKDITNAIESEFWADEVIDANTLNVSTNNGIVTLTGTAKNILTKDRAEKIAKTIKGVLAVVNRIKIDPSVTRSDDEIVNAVNNALLVDPATESYDVNVKVNEGVVTLTGSVDSWAEKQLCSTVAKKVKGVREIKNEILIDYETTRSDADIEMEVKGRLANDVQIDDYLINVEVDDGNVKLSGTVGSSAEKTRAEHKAWVAGVESVDSDDLKVEWWARDRMRRKELFVLRSDKEIKEAVEKAFLYDPRVLSFNADAEVNQGKVILTGIVDNLMAKRAAEQDAQNTVGVLSVKNHIKVRPENIPPDDELMKRVNDALLNDPYVERYDVELDVSDGWVYLSGEVKNSFEKKQAEKVVEGVKGVANVVNNITYEQEWTWKPDWEIKDDVEYQLTWSPFVYEDQINVSVDEGIVTLTGEVDNWSEFKAAEKNAFDAGAKDVINRLTVERHYYGPHDYWGFPYQR